MKKETKEFLIRKLTSRKFWVAIIGLASALLVIFNVPEITQEQIIALISAISVVIAYIVGEGIVDAQNINKGDKKDD